MAGKPKGAMGSPYTSSENGPSMASLMGDAFDRLHENSWDGGKQAKEKRKTEEIEKINAEIDKKLQGTELIVTESQIDAIANNDISVVVNDLPTDTVAITDGYIPSFSKEDRNDLLSVLIQNKCNIISTTDTAIVFEFNNAEFKLMAV